MEQSQMFTLIQVEQITQSDSPDPKNALKELMQAILVPALFSFVLIP